MDLPVTLPTLRVDAELRYNLFLALKETLNNIVKHSQATEVWLRLRIEANSFALIVEDNGQGLCVMGAAAGKLPGANRIASGSGLSNLEKRMANIGGRCVVQSAAGQGTRVELTVTMNGATSPVVATGRNGDSN
jgi:signal transduction histidine kinase